MQLQQKIINDHLLTPLQKENFKRDGFLIIENFIPIEVCDMLIERAHDLIATFDPTELKVVFSTTDQHHAQNSYFLDSGDKIRFFFEPTAINELGELKTDTLNAINKIGHALHDLDPVFYCFSHLHKIAVLVNELDILDPLLLQSMYICKQPYFGSEVMPHQDGTYLYVKEQPVIGLWFALEDAMIQNGCLWAIPGAHHGPLKSRMIRDKNNRVATVIYDDTPWMLDKMIPLEVPRGSVIVLHGLLPHMSKENLSPYSREAYSLHIISGQYEYEAENWLQRAKDMPLKGFL